MSMTIPVRLTVSELVFPTAAINVVQGAQQIVQRVSYAFVLGNSRKLSERSFRITNLLFSVCNFCDQVYFCLHHVTYSARNMIKCQYP